MHECPASIACHEWCNHRKTCIAIQNFFFSTSYIPSKVARPSWLQFLNSILELGDTMLKWELSRDVREVLASSLSTLTWHSLCVQRGQKLTKQRQWLWIWLPVLWHHLEQDTFKKMNEPDTHLLLDDWHLPSIAMRHLFHSFFHPPLETEQPFDFIKTHSPGTPTPTHVFRSTLAWPP